MKRPAQDRNGASLVEILIVVAIIALLLQLAIPAVEMARESARRTQCTNNLRQIALATQSHVAARDHYPAGGWSWQWVGDRARGYGKDQPGGWIYNLLPYLEQGDLHARRPTEIQSQPLALFHCPSRRIAKAYPNHWRFEPHNADVADTHARTDYAANGGDFYTNLGPGPTAYTQADDGGFLWSEYPLNSNGISHCRSVVRPAEIADGLSNTYLVGEKYLSSVNYKNGIEDGDDFTMYQGDDMDIVRWTSPSISDPSKEIFQRTNAPRQDDKEWATGYAFGSPHPAGWHVALCDGSVQLRGYELEGEVHRRFGNRHDEAAAKGE